MIKNGRIKVLVTSLLLVLVNFSFSQSSISYSATNADIANPERGWYNHTQTWDENYSPLNTETLISNRENKNVTLVLRLFYLRAFIDKDEVSLAYREKMQADFEAIRAAGVKCIVRFAYSAAESAEVWDATPEKVFSHIESLGDVLYKNSDVIAGVQAGFIGVWGEWYYTKNFAGAGYQPSDEDKENRRLLVEKLLSVLPEHINVQGRTPAIMRNANDSDEPITFEQAFDGSFKSRLGHHNDCFMADASDYGTYTNKEIDMPYLNETTKYTITGGETCDPSNSYSDCDNSVERMKEFHWTYLNSDYNKTVYNKWIDQGCYSEVNLGLGYRIRLKSATISDVGNPGESISINLGFSNDGFAAPTQYKPINMVFTHTESNNQITVPFVGENDDIRYWLPGEINLSANLEMPDDMAEGNYTLSIAFPDQDSELSQNPAYSIQLANRGIWNPVSGLNELNHIVSIGNEGVGTLPEVPMNIEAQLAEDMGIVISWEAVGDNVEGYELMRAENGNEAWVSIATIGSDESDYLDLVSDKHNEYNYCVRSINAYGYSIWSEIVSVQIQGVSIPEYISNGFSISPNPLHNNDLQVLKKDPDSGLLLITNTSGNIIYKGVISNEVNYIDRTLFNSGVYIVSIITNEKVWSRKLVVH